MNKNTQVKINRSKIATSLAAVLPECIFYNTMRVTKVSNETGRIQVKVLNQHYWFDAEAVEKA